MPAAIPWGENELEKLASSSDSRIFLVQEKIPVVLQPFHLQDLKSAVRDLLNASIDSYHKSLNGIILSYKHLKVISKSASVAAETSGVVITIQADFFVFRPDVGNVLKGVVNKISKDHVGVLLYHRFNISCPRPSSESRSSKWLGNQVSMHQEVTLKVKEANFSGTLPFLKGKLLSVGSIIATNAEEDKKSKKKKKDKAGDESVVVEPQSSLATSTTKAGKHKLDETEGIVESKSKKSKKDSMHREHFTQSVSEHSNAVGSTSELQVPKKKKRVSIGTEEHDFIPKLPLDFSQLPEDLPPPNADSTHFDVAKNLSSLNKSEKKKRKKEINIGLSDIREESSEVTKSSLNMHSSLENDSKSQHAPEEKAKKKKEKKEKKQKSEPSSLPQAAVSEVLSPKKLIAQFPLPVSSLSQVEARDISDPPRKKKIKQQEPDFDLKKEDKKTNIVTNKSVTVDQANLSASPTPKKKKSKNLESDAQITEPLPIKEKKPKKDKKVDLSVPSHSQENKTKVGKAEEESQALSQSKKRDFETFTEASPSKKSKKKQGKEVPDVSDSDSDATIPPGQRIMHKSPVKTHPTDSPERGLSYFPPRAGLDPDLGPMRGARRTPLLFGHLDKKVLAPDMSPVKSSPSKKVTKYDSDSDTPKKVVISTSVRRKKSDSDDSDGHRPAANSPQKHKRAEESSDESDSDTAVKSKLLQSMGVMQSPLKTAKPHLKQDSSDSESDGSINEPQVNVSKFDKSFSQDNPKNIKKSNKPILANQSQGSPKQNEIKVSKPKLIKGQPSSAQAAEIVNGGDSDDSDLEMMKNAIALLEQEQRLGIKRKKRATPKKKNVKETTPVSMSMPLPTPSKQKNSKEKVQAGASNSLVNSTAAPSKKTEKLQKPLSNNSIYSVSAKASQISKKIEVVKKKTSDSDSDSGPDDRNTSDFLANMRIERQAAEAEKIAKSTKSVAKSKKHAADGESAHPNSQNSKSKKLKEGHSKESTQKESKDVKKPKSKGKKKTTDDEISDVMQRLLREAKKNVGLA
ncbi:DNA-directed RNA polymerase I subunit RPA43 [Frankliniella fusca]|uniref:DNA-directed RNA polymerase I subunit RPA43 n=1 Tax=Frankliniella fusca TaxID=407009 RepID=A0AAE1HCB4_9NEOP|nr:DNA-directed RNA polymerase I subunit RPA43 [Frankliniella fusca]